MEKQQPSEAEIEDAKIERLRENAEILRENAGALRMFAEARDGAGDRQVERVPRRSRRLGRGLDCRT